MGVNVHRLERKDFQQEQVERALNQVRRFARGRGCRVGVLGYRDEYSGSATFSENARSAEAVPAGRPVDKPVIKNASPTLPNVVSLDAQ